MGVRSLALVVLGTVGLVGASAPAQAQTCVGDVESDFDGDGVADLAIGDPDATVSGAARSGSVHIAFGNGDTQTITQLGVSDNDNAAGDRFGHALASTDWNGDGCSDLFIGVPFENWANNTKADAGVIVYIPGSPSGLDQATAETWNQATFGTSAASEPGDQFGHSLTAGTMINGTPYLVAGAPGESIGTIAKAGMVIYSTPTHAVNIHQDSTGVPGVAETGDLYGFALSSSPTSFTVAAPGEAIGDLKNAGMVQAFVHNAAESIPSLLGGIHQDTEGISGAAESGDLFGYAVAMVDYTAPGGSGTSTLIAVSTPGEDGGSQDQGGVYEIAADGSLTEKAAFNQGTASVEGAREDGDLFGTALALVNRSPGSAVSWEDLLLAVGAPGEDLESSGLADRGWVQVFSMIGEPGDHDVSASSALEDGGVKWRSGMQLGISIHATAGYLYIADPWSTMPAVYGIPWNNLVAGAEATVQVYTPEDFGVSAAASGSFGMSFG
ncbi:VCBS repeat-containing protein [Glycomyces sp. L485]|uniref:FG-GAP repeat domain-containing protein n=1 Tax=Glycomyces sp. L485 TaxID=2909235 RepID=UPI001F4B1B84|nr:VCBS repeat-containing protein [Glycomyces sp. L485]MCH7232151.1 VCBS repeat-containing protein [Glycomyces sp. L485]